MLKTNFLLLSNIFYYNLLLKEMEFITVKYVNTVKSAI